MTMMAEMLNKGVVPVVPQKGSLGASGDLAPLAHMSLPLLGKGRAYYQGVEMDGGEAMAKAGIQTLDTLVCKEGLGLTNGTCAMTSVGTLALYDTICASQLADLIASMSMEALTGLLNAFDERVHAVRGHKGQLTVAKNFRLLTEGSEILSNCQQDRVQDAYSLRCIPQVHGAIRDAIDYVTEKVSIELNAVTDNPLVFLDDENVISGGNFHGEPMALAFDFLGIACSEIADISERRTERMVNAALSNGLTPFLTTEGGVNSGYMIVQYSAASMVSENKVLAHPASVDSIPSSANQEDMVSMGHHRRPQGRLDCAEHPVGFGRRAADRLPGHRHPPPGSTPTARASRRCTRRFTTACARWRTSTRSTASCGRISRPLRSWSAPGSCWRSSAAQLQILNNLLRGAARPGGFVQGR